MKKLLLAALLASPIASADVPPLSRPIVTMSNVVNASQCADSDVTRYPDSEAVALYNFAIDVLDETAAKIGYDGVERLYSAADKHADFHIDREHCDALIQTVVMPYIYSGPITPYNTEAVS